MTAAGDRATNMALLLLQMGLASEAEVFPNGLPSTMPALAPKTSFLSTPAAQPWWWPFGRTHRAAARQVKAPPAPKPTSVTPPGEASHVGDNGKAKDKAKKVQVRLRWSDEQLASLHPAAVRQRSELLAAEEAIHDTLTGIENTRQTYLVPAESLPCQKAAEEVARCYHRVGAVRQVPADDDGSSPAPRLSRSTLHCSPAVDAYAKCAADVADRHVADLP